MTAKTLMHSHEYKSNPRQHPTQPAVRNREAVRRPIHPSILRQHAGDAPGSLTPAEILQLQRIIGNRAVGHLLPQMGQPRINSVAHDGELLLQRSVKTTYGEFTTDEYGIEKEAPEVGANITLNFMPAQDYIDVGLTKVGMVQTNRRKIYKGMAEKLDTTKEQGARTTMAGWAVDRTDWSEKKDSDSFGIRNNNPVYQSEENSPPDEDEEQKLRISSSLADTGEEPVERGQTWEKEDPEFPAVLKDHPRTYDPKYTSEYSRVTDEFETAALELNTGLYLGSVHWGWEADQKTAKMNPEEITKASDGVPFEDFMDAAKAWNEQKLHDYTTPEGDQTHKVNPIQLPLYY